MCLYEGFVYPEQNLELSVDPGAKMYAGMNLLLIGNKNMMSLSLLLSI
jgi:hypothetical protein